MKAVVMAGGQGTRLRPLTSNQPKPMVPVVNKPTALHILELLSRHGVRDVVMTVAFMPQLIQNYFGDGSAFDMRIEYSVEASPLGTAGSVKNAESSLDDTFLVISGDSLTDFDLSEIVAFHHEREALVTIALKSVDNPLEFGVVIVDEEGRIERFLEKPGWGQVFSDTINTGIYVLEPEIFDHIPQGQPYDFSHELFPRLHELRKPLYGMLCDGYWQDIGTLAQFVQANRDALDGKVRVQVPGVRLRGNVWLGHGVDLESIDRVEGPALIGDYARVSPNATIGAHTVLGNNVVVRDGASIFGSVVGDRAYVGPGVRLTGAVIGSNVDLRANADVSAGAVLGDGCSVGEKAVIGSDVKIYPDKVIEAGASVRTSVIWESRGLSSLFGKNGVRGLINVDVTPELVMRLAMSYGTVLTPGAVVTASRDWHPATRVFNRALVAGLNATGVSVRDLRVAPGSLNRFDLRSGSSAGGVHLRVCRDSPEEVEILFSTPPGIPIGPSAERAIENIFYREDYRRASPEQMGTITFPARLLEGYLGALLASCDVDRIRARKLRLVLDHGFSASSIVLPNILHSLDVEIVSINAAAGPDQSQRARGVGDPGDERLRKLVAAMGADLGVCVDPAAEGLYLLDENGERVSDEALLLFLMRHACERHGPGNVALPVHMTRHADEVAAECGANVVRTRAADSALFAEATRPHTIFAATTEGRFILPSFLPAPDSLLTLVLILETVAMGDEPVSVLLADLPKVIMAHAVVPCPWGVKGGVMRQLVEEFKNERVSLLDGIKLAAGSGDWVQYLPDAGDPVFHIYTEADTEEEAGALLGAHTEIITRIISELQSDADG
ncbi:MAG: NTP transferase domain-containing protein [Actinobacteria bacterium]|nr:NTP transferase domain-containing protein [Actinomycetota bacterium]